MKTRWIYMTLLILVIGASCGSDRKMKKMFHYGKFQSVISHYQNILKYDSTHPKANYLIAESYRRSNRIQKAEPFYAQAIAHPSYDQDSIKLMYAKAMQANGKHEQAKQLMEEELAKTNNRRLQRRLQAELTLVSTHYDLPTQTYYRIKNLERLNTPFAEYAPYYINGQIYFTSSRANTKMYEVTGTPFTDLYKVASQGAHVDLSTLEKLKADFNKENVNEGCVTFSQNGKIMIFAKGNTGKRKDVPDVDLYLSRFIRGRWTNPQPININQPGSWESTPMLSADGRTLYFSSNRRGGFGGLDLYSATMDSRGRFGRVRNLGPLINTVGNELFPYRTENDKFFFSSDGHLGFGMLDIFEVAREKGKTIVKNVGKPVNSASDDFGIFLVKPDRGFFCSNRDGGKGDDDIYTFVNEDPNLKIVNYTLRGKVYMTRRDSTLEILNDVTVSLLDSAGTVLDQAKTTSNGAFSFSLYENENYTLMGQAPRFLTKRQPYTTYGKSLLRDTLKEMVTQVTFDTIMVLDRMEINKIFVLKDIYFDYDQSYIRQDAALELDKLVTILTDNLEIIIEMSAHTDSVASHAYNLELSQRRAESTVAYLIRKGIDPKRLSAKGYGEEQPIAPNTNPDGTDNPQGRARNRRTEFKILEIVQQSRPSSSESPPEEDDADLFFERELKKNRDEEG